MIKKKTFKLKCKDDQSPQSHSGVQPPEGCSASYRPDPRCPAPHRPLQRAAHATEHRFRCWNTSLILQKWCGSLRCKLPSMVIV